MAAAVTDLRRKWLGMLATLVSPAFPADATAALLAYLPFLDDIPEGAFTRRSLEAVVASNRRQSVPSLDELRIPLLAWWRDNQPEGAVLEGPDAKLTVLDKAWVRYWQIRRDEAFRPFGSSPGGRAHVASLVRERSAAAWHYIQAGHA